MKFLPAVIYEFVVYPGEDGVFRYVSDNTRSILGVSPDEIANNADRLFQIIDSADREKLKKLFTKAEPAAWQLDVLATIDEKSLTLQFNNKCGLQDRAIVHQGIITPAPAIHRKESLSIQSLLDKLPIGVAIHVNGQVVLVNQHAASILGHSDTASLIGANVLDYVHPNHREKVKERISRVLAGVPVPMSEQQYIRVDGRAVDVEAMAYPVQHDGEQAVQIVFRDISEKKQAEIRMKKNETLFSQLFQNVPMAVVMLDEQGKVFQVNKGFEQMFGFEKSELRGRNLNDFIVPEELRNEGIDLNNLITSNQVVSIETIRRHRSGSLVNVILCGVPVMLDNQTIGIYGVYIDITDRKRVEEELKIRNTELDNFVYKVSHDLRAPLSSILGLVNLSRLPGNTDNPRDYIDIIGEKVQALDHFIGDVLSHSKNLKMEVNIGPVDIAKIINQTLADLNYLEGAKEMKCTVKIEGIDFFSDFWRISEIFRNLISNAIKYRQLYVQTPEINIKVHIDHLRADISFADNGIGIDEANLAKIFEMFYRATEQSDGSGIGLYIVKNAVEKLGGQISVSSKVGQGTRFNILLPNRINSVLNRTNSTLIEQR